MSFLNTQTICLSCAHKEVSHPKYKEARKAELDAVMRGDFNFSGILDNNMVEK